jgi:ABC-type transport system substrate-binding protein
MHVGGDTMLARRYLEPETGLPLLPAHDIGEARGILEDDGWKLADNETVRRKNDAELRITLMTDQDPLRGAVANLIAEQLRDIGMDVTVVQQSSNDLVREFLIPRQYQAAVFALTGPTPTRILMA